MLRFAVVLSLALALASAVILLVVHQFALSQAEQSATRQAGLVASTLLQREVHPTDLDAPVPVERRRELDVLFRTHVLAEDTLGVLLVRRDGLVTYATDHRAIGTVESKALSSEAAGGTIVSRVSAPSSGRKTLDTYAPVGPGGGGAALISEAYAPIESAARAAELRVGVVLEALLVALFLVFVPLLSRVTKRIKQQIERIHFQAYYDGLTGLPNRAHLFERLQLAVGRAAEEDRTIAILLLDLDRFREINDTLGHDAGDTLLEETAARLRDTVEEETILARLGADEFAVVVEYADEDQVNAFAERLRAAIEPPIVIEAMPVGTDGTVGIAFTRRTEPTRRAS